MTDSPHDFGKPLKRSVSIARHRTSLSLELSYWATLKTVAERKKISLSKLVSEIDSVRGTVNLSSAVRQFVLKERSQ
jgi:predicted DNA-binding ribbon-helix-helix protein